VREAFVRLYEKGLIYRGPRLINWSPGLRTAVSDLEVEHSEEDGLLYYFKYPLKDSDEYIPVATTRPETILADTAVAVHPEDERFKDFIGKTVLVPILNREIPVIGDEYVDREFGTGALKITPGHDPNDYAIGERHNLPVISMLDEAATVTKEGGPYESMERFEARKKLWADMTEAKLILKTENYKQRVPRSQRGGEIIEPMISTQWFVDIDSLAKPALAAVDDGRIQIVPDHFTKVYRNWMSNIQDWCISRQLWWGHRIPVWYASDGSMYCARSEEEALAQAREKLGEDVELVQDPDVLDTWFSSGLWPFSTLGWPEKTADLDYFYPTSVLETGYDILFFWVARMIMLGMEFTGKTPFHTIYLHGIIRDEQGRKMSKTLGNVIDPLIVMDEYGTDALRFSLLVGSTPGQDVNVNVERIGANRNFANKLWNAARFVIGSLPQAPKQAEGEAEWTLADQWIWARLTGLIADVDRLFANYQFGEAGRQIHEFFWSEFADWYIEIAKLQLTEGGDRAFYTADRLIQVTDICLRLLHPFTPFVTEEIWGHLKEAAQEHSDDLLPWDETWADALIIARWPEGLESEKNAAQSEKEFGILQDAVRAIRNLRSEKSVNPGLKFPAMLASKDYAGMLEENSSALAALAKLDPQKMTISQQVDERPEDHVALVSGPIEIYLPLAEMVDPVEEHARLEAELKEAKTQIKRLEGLLRSDFAKKAPAEVVEKEKLRLAEFKQSATSIEEQLKDASIT
jgi:valyl-tRNA synthetase